MFNFNQYNLINHLLAYGPTSRKKLAKVLNISTAAVTMSVNYLIEDGIVCETKENTTGRVGRKEILIDINPNYALALGIDVKDNFIRFSSCDLRGNIKEVKVFFDVDTVVEYVSEYIKGKNILGMTVLIKAFIDKENNEAFDKSIFNKLENLDVKIDYINNIEALSILHKYYFYDDKDYLLVKYGDAVGSAICVNNHMVNQDNISNEELGNVLIYDHGYYKLNDLVSYKSFNDDVNDDNIIEYLLENPDNLNILKEYLSLSIVNANVLLSLDKVILAGKIFVNDSIFNKFEKGIKELNPNINVVKIDKYEDKRMMVGSVVTIYNQLMTALD